MNDVVPPAKKPSWLFRSVDLAALIVSLILLGAHISWIDAPWDNSHCGVNSGAYYGYACKGLEAHGPLESRFQGPLLFHPEGRGLYLPYTNHPGTIYSIFYPAYRFMGRDERSLRIPIVAILALNLILFRFLLAPVIGRLGAAAAVVGFASLPMIMQYGKMVDIPIFCVAFFIPVTLLWLRHRRLKTRKSWWAFACVTFVAGLFDWFCYFLFVGMLLDILFSRLTLKEKVQKSFAAGLPFLFSFAVVFGWIMWAERSIDRLTSRVEGLLMAVGIRSQRAEEQHFLKEISWDYWLEKITSNAGFTFTGIFLGITAVGLLGTLAVKRYRNEALRPGLMLVISGLLPCIVFRTHASQHEFWPMVGLSGLVLFFGQGIRTVRLGIGRINSTAAGVFAMSMLLWAGALGLVRGFEYKELRQGAVDQKQLGEDLNRDFTSRDLVFGSDGISPSRFYKNFVTVPQATTPRYMRQALASLKEHKDQFDRCYILWNSSCPADWKWLQVVPARGGITEVKYAGSTYFKRELDLDKVWDF